MSTLRSPLATVVAVVMTACGSLDAEEAARVATFLPASARMETPAAAPCQPAAAHRIVHKRPPLRWEYGFPLGNGDVGVMVWGDGAPLALTLDKSDLWDLRSNADYMGHRDGRRDDRD